MFREKDAGNRPGASRPGLLESAAVPVASPSIKALAEGVWHGKTRDQILSTGYVVDTLEAALWCVDRTDNFADAVLLAINLAGDADTVGAVTGQIAGALYGESGIPARWRAKVVQYDRLRRLAIELYRFTPA